ncbi:hypothetical protein CON07_04865 [Bacillus sp. AFS094611]|uniref:hypothetical protein n=1 Tax=Bacillus sp. AFS094611 TaxID=2033516 RepID=UPI000BEC9184|nr:hypothetical protein [Bacillus sp. AFS094611]PDZ52504.1 hypothetical protein CON07_04865 [Bacillus sp. AFS094611]
MVYIQTNNKLSTLESDVEKIKSIAKIASVVSELDDKVNLIIEQAQQELPSEFIIETEGWSTQSIINQIINADFTSVSVTNNSHNRLENVDINSNRTHLRTKNHSSNYLKRIKFNDFLGTVDMNGITKRGNIQVTGNSVRFGKGGAFIFGNQNELRGNCSICNNEVFTDKFELQRYTKIQCSKCLGIFGIKWR